MSVKLEKVAVNHVLCNRVQPTARKRVLRRSCNKLYRPMRSPISNEHYLTNKRPFLDYKEILWAILIPYL